MGWNDCVGRSLWEKRICPNCKNLYECYEEEQVVGARQKDEEVCPYCGYIIGKSMEYEFKTRRIQYDMQM